MNTDSYVRKVQEASVDLDSEAKVFSASEAVLSVLSHRITEGQAATLADQLPEALGSAVTRADGDADGFGVGTFVDRVSDREESMGDLDPSQAPTHVRAVLSALSDELQHEEWTDAVSQLPPEYGELYA
ncbi:DUF2267 domain-containing protein [Halobium salinum]|uniref:DUF2267 domain-containing protein n=1 Tax=Halobium salinum TaxID=1364940 RepID=A0ABD5PGF2_9EURY|nr:DUF2267 domain-containing protein [Halobium salinum]